MNKGLKVVISSIIAIIFISGCGGGGSSSSTDNSTINKPTPVVKKLNGYYIDSAVKGIDYNCETTTGKTDSKGKFKFEHGHNCKFYLNKKLLRSVNSNKLFNGTYILEDNNKTASILQTMDLDGNASNGLQIVPEALSCVNSSVNDINTSVLKQCLDSNVSNYTGHEVNATEAAHHIKETIQNNKPIANESNITATEDRAKEIILTGSDPQGDSLTYIVTQQPTNGSLSGSAAHLIYTPNVNYNGSDSFKFKVSDGTFESNESTVNITVNAVNDAPTAVNDIATVNEDANVSIDVLANDSDEENDTLTISTVETPANGSAIIENGKVKYAPISNYNGNDSFTYTISDGNGGSDTATVNVTVNPTNDNPIANDDNLTTDEDTILNGNLSTNDTPSPDGGNVWAKNSDPLHGSLSVASDGTFIYAPTKNYNGNDSFEYKITDADGSIDTATVHITVNPINDVPTATEQNVTTAEDNNKSITLTGSDIDGDSLNYTVTEQPSHGMLISENGANFIYIPNANYNGNDSFKFKVNDGTTDSKEATVTITITPLNDAPIANDINASTSTNTNVDITLAGRDIDSNSLTYSITQNPAHGSVSVSNNIATYIPNANFNGSDSFKYIVNDGSLDSNEATVLITVDNNIHITNNYQYIPLGKGKTINQKIYLDSSAKNLYLVLSNESNNSTSSVTISHNARVTQENSRQSRVTSSSQKPVIKYAPKYITDFNKNSRKYLIKSSNRNFNIVETTKSASVVGDSHIFYLSKDTSSSTVATLKSVVSNISTDTGTRTLNVWVSDDSFGSGCAKATCVTQDMVDTLADKFLKSGSNNDIYDWVTNIYGKEWGSEADKYSNLITKTDTIDILLTDIDGDNNPNGGVVGYFWSKDNYTTSSVSGSNQRIMFYADSVMFANTSKGDFWQKELYITLAHEFQHMINFYQKNIIRSSSCETWLNELMSVTTEDLVTKKLEHNGDRGVSYADGSAGDDNNTHGRFPRFNEHNDITLTNWGESGNILNDYSKVASFGAFLVRNYGGAELMHNMMDNNYSDENEIIDAIKTTTGKDVTFIQLLQEWGVAVVLSSIDSLTNAPQYNFGDFLTTTYNGISYDLGSINFFNYDPEPTLHTTVSSINPHANYYYKIGENITSASVDLNVTLDANTSAVLIAK